MPGQSFTLTELKQASESLKRFLTQNQFDPNGQYQIDYIVQSISQVLTSEFGIIESAATNNQPPSYGGSQTALAATPATSDNGEQVIKKIGLHPLFWRPGGHELILTNRRIILRGGLLGTSERSIPLSKVQDVTVKYDVKGKIAGYGTIRVESAGSSATEIVAENMADTAEMKNAILAHLS